MARRSRKPASSYDSHDCLIGLAEDFYHVEQLRHLLGNKLTLPLTVLGRLREGKRVSRGIIERAVGDVRAIAEHPLLMVTDEHVQRIHS